MNESKVAQSSVAYRASACQVRRATVTVAAGGREPAECPEFQ